MNSAYDTFLFQAAQLHIFHVSTPSFENKGSTHKATLDLLYEADKKMSREVLIKGKKPPILFVETDKPYYKPGDLVQFRILLLDNRLKPVSDLVKKILFRPLVPRNE
jgi:hypothetical protein